MRMVKRFGLALGLATLLAASVSADVPSFNCPNGAGGFCVGTGGASGVLSIVTGGLERMSVSGAGVITFPNGTITLPASSGITFGAFGSITAPSNGVFELLNSAGTGFGRLQFGGTTASFPAIKQNAAALNFRLADDSADAAITASTGGFSGIITETQNALGTTSTDGLININTTAATAGTTVQISPRAKFCGTAWNSVGAASETDCMKIEVLPATVAGATTEKLVVSSSIAGGAFTDNFYVFSSGAIQTGSTITSGASVVVPLNSQYQWSGSSTLGSPVDGQLQLKNNAQTITVTLSQASLVTAPTDSTAVDQGSLTRFRSSSTISPATGGVGNCGAAFQAAALTADCTIATLPAGQKLVAVYADVTAGFTCSATCTGTKVVQAGTAAGGTQVLAAGLNVAVTGTFGLADADLGSGMTRAAAIQGGLIGSWGSTTIISARFTSGTGNWGTGAATNVNAGTIKFTLITEQVK